MTESIKYAFALDQENRKISIEDACRGNVYFCFFCKAKMVVKKGEIRTWHFAHKGQCTETWRYETSPWHIAWQKEFPKENREKEVVINGIKHVADVLINNVVIEIQHSRLNKEEFLDRNQFYTKAGYEVIWIFDFINGDNNKNIELLCRAYTKSPMNVYIFKEYKNTVLTSMNKNIYLTRISFINMIKDYSWADYFKPFNKDSYLHDLDHPIKLIDYKDNKSESFYDKYFLNVTNTDSDLQEYTYRVYVGDNELIKRDIPAKLSINKNEEELDFETLIEQNTGKSFWALNINTGNEYYFENTSKEMLVWVLNGSGNNKLDMVHEWQTFKVFKSNRWKIIG